MIEHAGYSRVGHHGGAAGRYVDAHDWVVASFFQHDSRDHDPQLHIHNGGLNRVQGPDGVWRTLDGRSISGGAAALVRSPSAPVRAAARALGVCRDAARRQVPRDRRRRPGDGPVQLPPPHRSPRRGRSWSQRSSQVRPRPERVGARPALAAGDVRDPPREEPRRRDPRGACSSAGTAAPRRDLRRPGRRRRDGARPLAGDTATVASWSPERSSRWRSTTSSAQVRMDPPDLTRRSPTHCPTISASPEGADVARLLDSLADEADRLRPVARQRRPGERAARRAAARQRRLGLLGRPAGAVRDTRAGPHRARPRPATAAQVGAAQLPPSRARGSSTACASRDRARRRPGRRRDAACSPPVPGSSRSSARRAPASRSSSACVARGVGRTRPCDGRAPSRAGVRPGRLPDRHRRPHRGGPARQQHHPLARRSGPARRRLGAGSRAIEGTRRGGCAPDDLVVVDESAMADTADSPPSTATSRLPGAKLLLVGDHRQLAAVGAGGGMELLANAGATATS